MGKTFIERYDAMTRKEVLKAACERVMLNDSSYGKPEDNFKLIADFWTVYLKREITPLDVSCMM